MINARLLRPAAASRTYFLPVLDLAPGATGELETPADNTIFFRPTILHLVGEMQEVRGHFKIKRTRLSPLNRENVIAYSRLAERRTTVEYRENPTGNFVRSYLPETVEYVHDEPLSRIVLQNFWVGTEDQLHNGAAAWLFSSNHIGNALPLATVKPGAKIVIRLHNFDDVNICVTGAIHGYEKRAD